MIITDKKSHEIQNEIDLIMDGVRGYINDDTLLKKLEELRDSIPCSCGSESPLCLYCQAVENETCDHMNEIEPCVKCECLSRDHSQDDKGECLNCDNCEGLEC